MNELENFKKNHRFVVDSLGRRIDYLRLSVTDRCNLRCVYCLPADGYRFKDSIEILNDEEILRLIRIASQMGISKVRVTGGEPLVRPGVVDLIRQLIEIPGIADVSLSTNGVLFSGMYRGLWSAGLRRVNISLDTLNEQKFKTITRYGNIEDVFQGLRGALEIGFDPVKINVVVMRGTNDDEISDFVALTRNLPVHVRFIELMPIGETGFFSRATWVSLNDIKAACGELELLPPDECPKGWGPALYYKAPGSLGSVGFISALSCNFCNRCNRLRLTSSGNLHPCLASDLNVDLGKAMRNGASDREIQGLIEKAVLIKPERHHMEAGMVREAFMCSLGG
ncbi:MAG: GTP 3',8-cyclase MoaA [Elusimicrobia bacterium]|nr:GTP 3',8-cyclase MoaA [Elusimicrobiota bacterium]